MNKYVLPVLLSLVALTVSAQSPLAEAMKLTDREQYERATVEFKKLLVANPADGATWYWFGENYFRNDQADSAEFCYRTGADKNPRFPLNKAGLGKIHFTRGSLMEAKAMFDDAIATAEDKTNKYGKEMRASAYREVARAYGSGPRPDVAAGMLMLNKALELTPADPECFLVKGDLLLAGGGVDVSGAVEAYKHAAELLPTSARPVAIKALMYYRAKSTEAAISEYDRAIGIDPGFAPAYSGRGDAYFRLKQYDKAIADYDKYLELNSGSITARKRYAKALYLAGKYTECLDEIARLQGAGVKDNVLKRLEGYSLCEKGDYANALERMKEYFADQPQEKVLPDDHEIMGRIYSGMAKEIPVPPVPPVPGSGAAPAPAPVPVTGPNLDSLAAEHYLKAARMDKSRNELYLEAGKAFTRAKLHGMAVAAYREKIATSGKPKSDDYYYLGGAAQKAKLYGTADSAWAQYVEKQPALFNGYLGRARAQAAIDSLKTTWQAKPFYEDVIRKMTADEQSKKKVELEEAYFYLGFYWFTKGVATKEQDLGMARCYFEKVKDLNAGTSNTKVGSEMLLTKELKDVAAKDCTLQ